MNADTLFEPHEGAVMRTPPGEPRRRALPPSWTTDRPTLGAARRADVDTSHDAAQRAKVTAGTMRAKCLDALRASGDRGLTDFELADVVGAQQTSAGKRRLELERQGLVEYAGTTRPTPSGANARVWRAVTEAQRAS